MAAKLPNRLPNPAATMNGSPPGNLARLAKLARDLDQKSELLANLRQRASQLQRNGLMVAGGELAHLDELGQHLAEALRLRDEIAQLDESLALVKLTDAEAALQFVGESLLQNIGEELSAKEVDQNKLVGDFAQQLNLCRIVLNDVLKSLEQGKKDQAPLWEEEQAIARMDASLLSVERLLREQQFGQLVQSMSQYKFDTEYQNRLQELHTTIRSKIDRNRRLSRQADLLLLQSPLIDDQRYQYTVLLRTASEPGSHGINIEDSSTLVKEDRESMKSLIDQVTKAVINGLARSAELRKASPPVAANPAPLVVPTPGTAQVDQKRRFAMDEPESPVKSTQILELIKDMGDFMYRLFTPDWVQRYLHDTTCSLIVTTNDLELPWELLFCNREFLCLERPVARMPMGSTLPSPKSIPPPSLKLRFLLIYSDPDRTLSAAEAEITQIQTKLQESWKDRIDITVVRREDATGTRLNKELRAGAFDVIHYAGHANFDTQRPDLSGLLLFKKEIYFAQKIRRLLEGRPLVFLNACESGRTANEGQAQNVSYMQQTAEGLAAAFIYGGALACIGPLWPVYDKPAADFAVGFYNKVLEGHMIGEAMRLARLESKQQSPDQITWAAFALYGDPTFRLAR